MYFISCHFLFETLSCGHLFQNKDKPLVCIIEGWPLNRGKAKKKGDVHCVLIKSISSPRKQFLNITFIRFSQK